MRVVVVTRPLVFQTPCIFVFQTPCISLLPDPLYLALIGTIAMLLVAGGIFIHNVEAIHHLVDFLPSMLGELLVGTIVGILALAPVEIYHKLKGASA